MTRFLLFLLLSLNACQAVVPWRLRSPSSLGRRVRPTARPLVREIARGKEVITSSLEQHPQWRRYQLLEQQATREELLWLTNHGSPAVRVYAFQALAADPAVDLWPVMVGHLPDNARVISRGYRVVAEDNTVGELMLRFNSRFTARQRRWLDSVLFTDPRIRFDLRQFLYLPRLPAAPPGYYPGIRRLAKRECHHRDAICHLRRQRALIVLATYQNPRDRKLIIKALRHKGAEERWAGLQAVQRYPDPVFRPCLLALQRLVAHDSLRADVAEWAPELRKALIELP